MSSAETRGRITVGVSDGVAEVVFDNPSQRNALTKQMCIDLRALMPQLDADRDVTLVTLRGAGDTFSAGATINELPAVLLDAGTDGATGPVDHLSRADDAITAVAKPTVALVDGACMGGGWQIASACDFILASERSVFAITPAKIGIIYPRVGIERLVRQVGHAAAKYILFTGETFSAARALQLGLIAESVPDAEFAARSRVLADTIRSRSQFSTHTMKHLVDRSGTGDPRVDQEWQDAWTAMTEGPDMSIGIDAFLARRKPEFAWRPTASPVTG